MPSPPESRDRALSSKLLPTTLCYNAVRARIEAQASAAPADPPTFRPPLYYDARPPPPSPFYTRPSPTSASAPTPNPAPSSSTPTPPQAAPPPSPSTPVAIINGYLGTSTTYPEAWPLSWLALTKYPRAPPQGQTPRSQPYINDNINAHIAVHLAYAPLDDSSADSSAGVAPTQPSSQPQVSRARSEEIQEEGLREEGEQSTPSLGKKRFLRPERHSRELYTETGLQGTRKRDFDSEYMEDPSASGSRSLRSISPGVGRREEPATSSSAIPVATIIPTRLPLSPLPPQPPLHRVLHSFTPTMHDELRVRAGELVWLLKVFDDGWCMVEDVLKKQEGTLPRQCISDQPEHHVEKVDDGIRASTTAWSSLMTDCTVISDPPELGVEEDDDIRATATALSSLSTHDEPKDQIIDFLAQLALNRKAARSQAATLEAEVAAMAAAADAIEARARQADAEGAETVKEDDIEDVEGERDRGDVIERSNGLNAISALKTNKAGCTQIVDHLANQEQQEISKREAKVEERLRKEAETERVIRDAEEEPMTRETATTGSSGQQQQKKKKKNKKKRQQKRGAW